MFAVTVTVPPTAIDCGDAAIVPMATPAAGAV